VNLVVGARQRLPVALIVCAVAVCSATAAFAGSPAAPFTDRVVGIELPPITSTLGTFAGVGTGGLPMAWRVQVAHVELSWARPVPITGGTFWLRTRDQTLRGKVTGGSVSLLDPGAGCRDQKYSVDATLAVGSFTVTLTHHRRQVLGHCLIFAASVAGQATISTA